MKRISRREFLKQTAGAAAALTVGGQWSLGAGISTAAEEGVGQVTLGKSGITVSRLALGTGTSGWKFRSNQTKLGTDGFVRLAQHAYERGITFFDLADIYGSHQYCKHALKHLPRERIKIMTKIWTRPNDWVDVKSAPETLDRFRKEVGTDFFDIVLIHCQVAPDWLEQTRRMRDDLSEAREKGLVRSVGVSCHSFEAMKAAAASDWVQIQLARINHTGARMDGTPEAVMSVLQQAHDSGKGVIGMKIFGCGDLVDEAQREASLQYVLGSGNVDAMTIGFEGAGQVDDTIGRVNRVLAGTGG